MCCALTALVLFGPRLAAILWWLFRPAVWAATFNTLIWPILGIIFMPWTLLIYMIAFPIDNVWNWVFLILAVIVDLGSYGGGAYGNRDRFGR
jgi:hypothetical protein